MITDDIRKLEFVPVEPPFGGVTDGAWVCARCRETVTGCALCAGMAVHIVPVRGDRHDR
jgi:hypothetical protein